MWTVYERSASPTVTCREADAELAAGLEVDVVKTAFPSLARPRREAVSPGPRLGVERFARACPGL
ncbi:hypothetical protein SVIO_020950 [Streptomyces violaceusniger]|uniref:Uncharacterized protein n=1 Tax=Streptomyces violaceusniger TaxID=68280 RepID=A0A4D4KS24_STRVO|nr:hypothetical protein SVIO_020950 [Streptomyces violaceusniger]